MSNLRVAVVTGGNKGIGFAVVKNIAKKFDGIVYLTARNESLGNKAVKELDEQGIKVKFHQLDISDIYSIKKFASYIETTHGGLDILVNNAAAMCDPYSNTPLKEQVANVLQINYFGTLNVSNALFPLLRSNARVVNVVSEWGVIYYVRNEYIRNKLMRKDLSVDEISATMNEFLNLIKKDDYDLKIYDGYKTSKAGMNAITRAFQHEFDLKNTGIILSAVNPGDVKTDMNQGGNLTPDQGAETIVYLSLLPDNSKEKRGQFWYQMNSYDWSDINLDLVSIFGAVYDLENVHDRN